MNIAEATFKGVGGEDCRRSRCPPHDIDNFGREGGGMDAGEAKLAMLCGCAWAIVRHPLPDFARRLIQVGARRAQGGFGPPDLIVEYGVADEFSRSRTRSF